MGLIFKISFRNLLRHKGKSLVIGTILFIGALFMSLGNGVITGTKKGIEKNLIDRVIGNITVLSAKQKDDQILGLKPMKIIGNFENVKKVLQSQDYIDKFLPITRGLSIALNLSMTFNDSKDPEFTVLFGIDFDKYQKMFDNSVTIVEGEPLKAGERGLLLNIADRKRIYNMQNVWILPKGYPLVKDNLPKEALAGIDTLQTRDNMVLMGMGDGDVASDIRLTVKGIFKFKNLNEVLNQLNLTDLESFRECFGYVTSADKQIEISRDDQSLLETGDENLADLIFNDLVSNNLVTETDANDTSAHDYKAIKKEVKVKKKKLDLDAGSYNLVFVKLKNDVSLDNAVEKMNTAFRKANIDSDVRAVSWEAAFAYIAELILFFRIVLSMLVNFIFFVAIVVIINTLSMTAMERTYEIGMMRAIGAEKGFVGKMFFTETSLLSFLFGGLGMGAGMAIVLILAAAEIPATGPMMRLVFGGDTFKPMIDVNSIILGIIQLMIVTLISMIYPIILARRITPLEAINAD